MHYLLTLLTILCLASAQAELTTLAWPALDTELPLWKPEPQRDNPKKTWPAIIYYHGTNSRPSIDLMRKVTSGQDFVLVGMTYSNRGRFLQSEANLAAERTQLERLKQQLISDHQVDPKKIYVAGFSKGGWFTATLLEQDRSLAGGLILAAGHFQTRAQKAQPPAKPFASKKPIFIGVGRFDGNYPQALAALLHFRKLGADVTLEAWPDTDHAYPKEQPVGLQQWLQLRAGPSPYRMNQWIERRQTVIEEIADPVARWYAWKTFQERPFVKTQGKHVAPLMEALEQDPKVIEEKAFEMASRDILRRELRDRYVTTLERVLTRYEALAQDAKGRPAGDIAAKDASRVRRLLEPQSQ